MKTFLVVSVVFLVCSVWLVNGQKKGRSDEESETVEAEADISKHNKKGRDREPEGRCSCRGLENQIDQLEFRLDRMIDLWNDFVDKNRSPYDQRGQYPGGGRQPPQGGVGGGRGPYLPPGSDGRMPPYNNRRPGYGGRSVMEDEQGGSSPRRFRF